MEIRAEVREIEKHIKSLADGKMEQVKIVSKAQGMTDDKHALNVLCLVKRRLIWSAQ